MPIILLYSKVTLVCILGMLSNTIYNNIPKCWNMTSIMNGIQFVGLYHKLACKSLHYLFQIGSVWIYSSNWNWCQMYTIWFLNWHSDMIPKNITQKMFESLWILANKNYISHNNSQNIILEFILKGNTVFLFTLIFMCKY